uniref:LRRCT domain-containing protein n=1 Tax=Anopheles minimus TaxID=112268 RepID=A0A182WJ91_9DIPT
MVSGGGTKFLRVIETEPVVLIRKLIVAISPSGVFLERIGNAFESIIYDNYREPTFHVPEGNTINEIQIINGTGLRAFIAGPNTHLEMLNIEDCTLDRLPQTLPKMTRLKHLSLPNCMLSVLRLDMLVDNPDLSILNLSGNQIRQIVPATGSPGRTLGISMFILAGNRLERLDMSVFASMPKLTVLKVSENRLTHLQASIPVTFPLLSTLFSLNNRIEIIDLRNVSLPKLTMLSLGSNRLTQMPYLPKTLPELYYLTLDENNLTQLDLSYFRPYRKLTNIYITSNQITSVRTSSSVRLPVVTLRFDKNKITSFNITGCDFPNATLLNLRENYLTTIPPVFEKFPNLRLLMDGNPLTCGSLLPYKDKIQNDKLSKDRISVSRTCDTTSSFMVGDEVKLQRVIEKETDVHILKLIVAMSPSGVFLQKISHAIAFIMYVNYREPTFLVPEGNTIIEIQIMRGIGLQAFIAGPNTQLEYLHIQVCTLDRLPQTLPKMTRLKQLYITSCMLSALRLDTLVDNPNLTTLDLSYNQIRQIFPVTGSPGRTLGIDRLILTGNRLERLDMSVFASMPKLMILQAYENRLTHIEASIPATIPLLKSLYLVDNLIEVFDLRNLTIPKLEFLALSSNALKRLPSLPKTLPELYYISLSENNLTQLDLSYFRPYRNLKDIYISSNLIRTVRTSSPVRLPVAWLDLKRNRITLFNITGCDFPNMTSLDLGGNRLSAVPPVFEKFPKLRLTMDGNPLTCDTLLPYKDKIQNDRLYKDREPVSRTCDTTSSFMVGEKLKCINRFLFICDIGVYNMITEGSVKLKRIVEKEKVVRTDKLIVAIGPTGPFLKTISPFIDSITYGNYHEPTFHVPEGNNISEINFMRATNLRAFIAGRNTHLEMLNIEDCTLDRLPQTLSNMIRLKQLSITSCMLSVLRLDMLVGNQNLTTLDLSYNQIRQIFPVTQSPGRTLGIEKLILSNNQLERLDMSVFASISRLDILHIMNNRLTHLEGTLSAAINKLATFYVDYNQIGTFDLRNLTLPSLSTVSLGSNNLKQMPLFPKALPELTYLSLYQNNLTHLDLSYFRSYRKLKHIYFMLNLIRTVHCSSHVRLPVESLGLTSNKIASFNMTGCSLPNITSLILTSNRLTMIPPVFERFPKVRVTMDKNPLRCETLLPYKDTILNRTLKKDLVSLSWQCGTTSSFPIGNELKIGPRPCSAQCKVQYAVLCEIGVVNMTSDGGAKIRSTIDSEEYLFAIGIEKLIVTNTASGPFLQRIAPLTESITYLVYREPVFQVPAGNTIIDIEITNAANLRSLVVGTNQHLKRLQVEYCQLDRVPPTLSQISELEALFIVQCAMTAVRLDVFAKNPKLILIDLSKNQIRQLFPMTSPPKVRLSVATIDLTANLLERLDMFVFVHMPDLERLFLQENRIVRFEASAPVTYALFNRLILKTNKISSFDARNLTLPALYSIYLDENALTEIPTHWGSMPNMRYLGFERNNLKQVDLSVFGGFVNLSQVFLSDNKIESIRTSSPITLPWLSLLTIDNNQLVSVNFAGCNFPEMYYISLTNNQLTAVPPLFQRFNSTRLAVDGNPIKCSNMMSFKTKIEEYRLYVSTGASQSECFTTSSIELKQNLRGCCVA